MYLHYFLDILTESIFRVITVLLEYPTSCYFLHAWAKVLAKGEDVIGLEPTAHEVSRHHIPCTPILYYSYVLHLSIYIATQNAEQRCSIYGIKVS